MQDAPSERNTFRLAWVLPTAALILLASGWAAYFYGQRVVNDLDLSRFGPCDDVCDSLSKDHYVAGRLLPYASASVFLTGLATVASGAAVIRAVARGGLWPVWLIVAGVSGLSLALHGLHWVVTFFFA